MSFDTSTLYLFATMVAGMLGAMLVFFGRQENIAALKWWGTAYLLGAASVAIWTIGGSKLGDTLLLALNAVGFAACGMVWNASRVFHGRKPNLPGLVFGAIVWIGVAVALPSLNTAMTVASGICHSDRLHQHLARPGLVVHDVLEHQRCIVRPHQRCSHRSLLQAITPAVRSAAISSCSKIGRAV